MTHYCDSNLKAKKVTVIVNLEVGNSPPFTFDTTLPRKKGSGKNDDNLIFKKGDPDGFLIRYELVDPFNVYSFGTDKEEALYSTDQPICPKSKGQWDQFKALCIEDNGMTLVVHNKNLTDTAFGYTLRVTKDGGANYLALDPIGTNENGNLKSRTVTAVALTVAGGVVGGLVAQTTMTAATTVSVLTGAVVGALIGLGLAFVIGNSRERMA